MSSQEKSSLLPQSSYNGSQSVNNMSSNEKSSLLPQSNYSLLPQSNYNGSQSVGSPLKAIFYSGTDLLLRAGESISKIVEAKYHILSFDPRGVNLTSPPLECFETSGDGVRFARDIEHLGLPFEVGGASNDSRAKEAWAKKIDAFTVALDQTCTENGNAMMLQSSSTAFVVRDMVSILEALGEKKLSYWGYSYGTILGATFAAMFPDLVGRMLLDGVSDASLYTNNLYDWGRSGMEDTHKTWKGFVDSCAESGDLGCAFAHNGTPEEIQSRFDSIMIKLQSNPLAVPVSKVGPGIITPSDIQYAVFHTLYKPKGWPALAIALDELEKGNGTLIYEMQNPNNALARKDPLDNPFNRSMESSMASTAAIMCSDTDSAPLSDTSSSTFLKFAKELGEISPTGEIWAIWVNSCKNWSSKAKEVYRGPWTVGAGLRKTSFPILFVSNTADPVTPLSAAITMSKGFGADSATLLIQNGFGHCSSAHPSLGTAKIARAYFNEGVVPEWGTETHSDPGFLFPHPEKSVMMLSQEDRELSLALEVLAEEIGGFY